MADGQQPVEGQLLMQMKSFQPVLSQSPESTAPSVEQLMEETANLSNDLTSANLVLVSNTFNATLRMDGVFPNIIIFSSDNTFFLVHYHILSSMSNNHFGGLVLPEHEDTCTDLDCDALELYLPEPASVLNVVLCTVYDLSSDVYHPTLDCLAESIEAMKKYGLPLHPHFTQSRPLYNTFLCHAALHPFEVYTLAAENNLEDLAAVASSYTLTHCIHDAPRDLVSRMGAHYLFRLFDLHWTRMDTLRRMFDVRLYPHSPKSYCSQQNRMVVARAFHLAGMQIFYTASAGIAGAEIKKTMDDLADSLSCPDCKNTVQKRVAEIIRHWVLLQRTI